MNSNRYRSPIIGAAVLGVACVSYIAYYFYRRSKKRSLVARLKQMYNYDYEFYNNGDLMENDDSYDQEVSDYSDYFLVQPEETVQRLPDKKEDKNLKFNEFEEVVYIEDIANRGRSSKVYKIMANPLIYKKTPNTQNHTHKAITNSNKSAKMSKKSDSSDGWTVLDSYSSIDGNAEEYTYVEATINTFSEDVDMQEGKSIQLKPVDANPNDCCSTKNVTNGCCKDVNFNNCCSNNSELQENESSQRSVTTINNEVDDELVSNKSKVSKGVDSSNICGKDEDVNGIGNYDKVVGIKEDEGQLEEDLDGNEEEEVLKNPESVKIYLKNFGCSHNISDSEYMLGLLDEYGFSIVNTMEESNIVIINSCTVKGPSEEGMRTFIRAATALNLPIIVSGCVPQADKTNAVFDSPHISLLGITQIDRIVEVVENSLLGRKMVLLEKKELPHLDLPKIRKNKLIEIIPLSTGCLGSCTFCKTKYSRGVLGSYDIEVLLDRVESCINEGVKEIWLTSEDLGAYGIDIGTNIVTLLKSIIAVLPPDTMLRLGMSNPPYIRKHIDEICDILLHDNVYEFVHIPVQSCSNAVLEKMNREYEVEEFLHLVETIRRRVPNCTIATDIITGFPTETEEDHTLTRKMLEELKLPVINISQFYPRKGTIASKMKQLGNRIGKNRSRDITSVFMSYETNSKYLNEVFKVYFNQINDLNQLIGHNKYYIKVMLTSQIHNRNNNINIANANSSGNNSSGDDTTIETNSSTLDNNMYNTSHSTDDNKVDRDRSIIEKYYGTVQYVKIVNTTKWHLEGIIV